MNTQECGVCRAAETQEALKSAFLHQLLSAFSFPFRVLLEVRSC